MLTLAVLVTAKAVNKISVCLKLIRVLISGCSSEEKLHKLIDLLPSTEHLLTICDDFVLECCEGGEFVNKLRVNNIKHERDLKIVETIDLTVHRKAFWVNDSGWAKEPPNLTQLHFNWLSRLALDPRATEPGAFFFVLAKLSSAFGVNSFGLRCSSDVPKGN